jgi:hypothetical protein
MYKNATHVRIIDWTLTPSLIPVSNIIYPIGFMIKVISMSLSDTAVIYPEMFRSNELLLNKLYFDIQ